MKSEPTQVCGMSPMKPRLARIAVDDFRPLVPRRRALVVEEVVDERARAFRLAEADERADDAPLVRRVACAARARCSQYFSNVRCSAALRERSAASTGETATVVDVASKSPSSTEPGM